jgi:hypothetical protein
MITSEMMFEAKIQNYARKAAKNPTVPVSSQMEFRKNLPEKQQKKPQKFLRSYINYISRSLFDKSFAFQ